MSNSSPFRECENCGKYNLRANPQCSNCGRKFAIETVTPEVKKHAGWGGRRNNAGRRASLPGETFHIRLCLPKTYVRKLDRIAKENRTNRSELIRQSIYLAIPLDDT